MTHDFQSARTGIGLRSPHLDAFLLQTERTGWVELHSENWMTEHGPIAERLTEIRTKAPVSLHGVGLSLGSADGVDATHLRKLKRLVDRCQPVLVSEHLSWGRLNGVHANDLLPMPFTGQAIECLVTQIDRVQQFLGRELLVENVSSYLRFAESTMPEWVFVREVVERADCGLLLDINNVYVNANNHGFDPETYLQAMPWSRVAEVHLAGYDEEDGLLIDTHGRAVQEPVWGLFEACAERLSDTARVLVEWDAALPPFAILLEQARRAGSILERAHVDA